MVLKRAHSLRNRKMSTGESLDIVEVEDPSPLEEEAADVETLLLDDEEYQVQDMDVPKKARMKSSIDLQIAAAPGSPGGSPGSVKGSPASVDRQRYRKKSINM